MPEIVDWVAESAEGHVRVRKGEVLFPPITTERVLVQTDVGRLMVDVDPGQQVRLITKRVMSQFRGDGGTTAMVEIQPDPSRPDEFVRLYVTAQGLVLTTKDL